LFFVLENNSFRVILKERQRLKNLAMEKPGRCSVVPLLSMTQTTIFIDVDIRPLMTAKLNQRLTEILGQRPDHISPLSGGCVGEVYRVDLPDGRSLVAKVDGGSNAVLDKEGWMLHYLVEKSALPVPELIHSAPDLLIMSFLPGHSSFDARSEAHAAALLADLHAITAPAYGLESDTLIGGLHQPNPWTPSWIAFFREQRLVFMARVAYESGRLPAQTLARIEKLAGKLERWLEEPPAPALIHGDIWSGNVLAQNGRITGFLDPAIYYADPEMELAFITLFHTFGDAFFRRYDELHGIRPGFWETRRDLYNLYPLLVHVRLFGGGYVGSVQRILGQFGV
jgi:fructosamine-3-kinase